MIILDAGLEEDAIRATVDRATQVLQAGGGTVGRVDRWGNRRWQNRQTNEWEEAVSFFNIVAWGSLGENASESLQKGSRVLVTGRLEQRSWETEDGEKRSIVEVVADEIGPSLRWATAQVVKNERRSGDGGGFSGGGGGGGASRPASNEPPPYGDEEPF